MASAFRVRLTLRRVVDLSLVLPAGAVIALVWANTARVSYQQFASALHFAVNDVGMALFFALAAKEVVEASAPGGALHTWRRSALPVTAAVGGMAGPALLSVLFIWLQNRPDLGRGWAIPCATDIAFSYLTLRAIFREHPAIPFLLLLAIVDDALGLVILALFYPAGAIAIGWATGLMGLALGTCWMLRRQQVVNVWFYLLIGGTLSWLALYLGGLHPALALVPVVPFMPHAAQDPGLFVEAPESANDTLSELEHKLKIPVQGVLLMFGLVNAGVPFEQVGAGTWTVLAAIVIGKPIGILAVVAVSLRAGLHLPRQVDWRDLTVVGVAAGIGFTVALFFATAAFPPGPLLDETKLGALFSILSAILAFAVAAALRVGRFREVRS